MWLDSSQGGKCDFAFWATLSEWHCELIRWLLKCHRTVWISILLQHQLVEYGTSKIWWDKYWENGSQVDLRGSSVCLFTGPWSEFSHVPKPLTSNTTPWLTSFLKWRERFGLTPKICQYVQWNLLCLLGNDMEVMWKSFISQPKRDCFKRIIVEEFLACL